MLVVVLGLAQLMDNRELSMDPDGIVYLDMADAYRTGQWHTAMTGLWPPLYAWVLGIATIVLQPSAYWEFGLVRLVNFLIYLFAAGSFHIFIREFIAHQHRTRTDVQDGRVDTLPDWAWMLLGYTLFLWSSLQLITLREDSPDMLTAALVYLVSAILVRAQAGNGGWRLYGSLGALLGLGYLAKGYMFFLSWVFLAFALVGLRSARRAALSTLVAVASFAAVSAPYVIAMSKDKGHFSIGDAGPLNYAFHIDGVPYVHWHGGPHDGNGVPPHPDRQILDAPAVYEFASPIGGTYPLWYDPSYWDDGAIAHFRWRGHASNLVRSVTLYYEVFQSGGVIAAAFLTLLFLWGIAASWWRDTWAQSAVFVPSLVTLMVLSLVHVEATHTGAFVTLLWMGLFASLRPLWNSQIRVASSVVAASCAVLLSSVGVSAVREQATTTESFLETGEYHPFGYQAWQVAEALHGLGIKSGDKVAYLGKAIDDHSWARLARVRLVAEVNEAHSGDLIVEPSERERIFQVLRSTGATAAVALKGHVAGDGWQEVQGTDHLIYDLRLAGQPR